jgi:haloalkane dehalogenase
MNSHSIEYATQANPEAINTSAPVSVQAWRSELKFAQLGSASLAYKTYGDINNPALVLLHGLPTSSYLYRNIAPQVAAQGYFVVVPDFIGFGASSKPQDNAEYNFSVQAERVKQLLKLLAIENFHLVAHDMGGLVGFELMVTDQHRIQSFLVLNTTAYKEGFTPPPEMGMLAGPMGGFMTFMMSNRATGKMLTAKFLKDNMGQPHKLDKSAQENYWWPMYEGATQPMRAVAKSFDQIMARYTVYQTALRQYSGAARLLWGAKDKVLNFEKLSAQFAGDLKLSADKIQSIKNAGHFLQEDFPEQVADTILQLLHESKSY